MDFEKLALMGIAIFGFMAFMQMFRTAYEAKRLVKSRNSKRQRRLTCSEAVAREIAQSVIKEIANKYPQLVEQTHITGQMPPKLEKALQEGMIYYLDRVSSSCKGVYYEATNEIILKKGQ